MSASQPGAQGPPGAGPAVTSMDQGTQVPLATVAEDLISQSITTSTAGRFLIHADLGQVNATCPFPNPNNYCSTVFGLYVDGIPIPGSARTIVDQRGTIVQRDIASITVLSPSRPAGVHTVKFSSGAPQTGGTSAFTPIYFNTHNDVAPQIVALAVAD